MLLLNVITLVVAGLLVGNEFSIAVFVHPVLCRLPDKVHLAVAIALARVLGRVMPFWYALTIVLTSSAVFVDHYGTGRWPLLIALSAGLWVLSIVYTITTLVPINNRIASWTDDTVPPNWIDSRSKWDQLHRGRVLLLAAAFVILATGILDSARP